MDRDVKNVWADKDIQLKHSSKQLVKFMVINMTIQKLNMLIIKHILQLYALYMENLNSIQVLIYEVTDVCIVEVQQDLRQKNL